MKKSLWLSLLLLIISVASFAQLPNNHNFSFKNTKENALGILAADSGYVQNKIWLDTLAANRSAIKWYNGAFIQTAGGLSWNRWDNRWVLQTGFSPIICPETGIINGSATWSTVGLIYDITNTSYVIGCRYFATTATSLTLSAADPSFARIDIIYVDTNNVVGITTGTPSTNPIKPQANPLSQLEMTSIYVPAGSTTPGGTTAIIIYDENIEWGGSSNVAGVNFAYPTNPAFGSVSTYLPSATDGQYVSWRNTSPLDIIEYEYLKFYIRLNAGSSTDPANFLTLSFYDDLTEVTSNFQVGTGSYGFDGGVVGSYQLITIPLTGITFSQNDFDKLNIVIVGAPSSFQLDRIYLLTGAGTPPVISNAWIRPGNATTNPDVDFVGTTDSVKLNFGTNGQFRMSIPADGINPTAISDFRYMVLNNDDEIETRVPDSIAFTAPKLQVTVNGNIRTVTNYAWGLTGDAGTVAGTNFLGTTDDVDLVFKRNSAIFGRLSLTNTSFGRLAGTGITSGTNNSFFGDGAGQATTTGTFNTAGGYHAMQDNTSGSFNTAYGMQALIRNTSGINNTAVGRGASFNNLTGEYNVAVGFGTLLTNTAGINNVAIGKNALNVSTADNNTAIGPNALLGNTTGTKNTGIGGEALVSNGAGSFNTGSGFASGAANITGNYNSSYGDSALRFNLSSSNNTGIGHLTLRTLTGGSGGNTAVGDSADVAAVNTSNSISLGKAAVAASNQFAISPYITQWKATGFTTSAGRVLTDVAGDGILTLEPPSGAGAPSLTATQIGFGDGSNLMTSSSSLTFNNTTKELNVNAVKLNYNSGTNSLLFGSYSTLSTGSATTAFGSFAADVNTGANISAFGNQAASQNTGANVTAIGGSAAFNNTGTDVTTVGHQAGSDNTGDNVTFVGVDAGAFNTGDGVAAFGEDAAFSNTGNNVTALGRTAANGNTFSNIMAVGNLSLLNKDNAASYGDTSLILYHGFGTTVPTERMDIRGNLRLSGAFMPNNIAGATTEFLTGGGAGSPNTWTGSSGTGNIARVGSPTIATPIFTTNITSPLIIGGSSTTQTLILRTTSGVGTTNADIIFQGGNNGGTELMRITNAGAATIPGTLAITGNTTGFNWLGSGLVRAGASSYFDVTGRSRIYSPSDGIHSFTSTAGTANTSTLIFAGMRPSYVAKTTTYTATATDYTIECTSGTFTVTLPTAVGITGHIYNIVNSGAGTITVGTTSSQTFVNVVATPTTLAMAAVGSVMVQSNGANWMQLK